MGQGRKISGQGVQEQGLHPCVKCGACCAYFRVAFYWREAEGRVSEGATPLELTEDLSPILRCMKGTNQKRGGHCVALEGRVGSRVGCRIYPNRPSPCRDFPASYENGKQNKRCDEARAAHGLRPLKPSDWGNPEPITLIPDQAAPNQVVSQLTKDEPVFSGNRILDQPRIDIPLST